MTWAGAASALTGGISIDVKRPEELGLCFRLADEMGGPPRNFPSRSGPLLGSDYGEPGSVAGRNGYGPGRDDSSPLCAAQYAVRPRPPLDQVSISGFGHRISGRSTVRSIRLNSVGNPMKGDPPPQVGQGVRLRDPPRRAIGDPDVKDLARANQFVLSSQNFFDRRDRVPRAYRVGVDGIGPPPFQARRHRLHHFLALIARSPLGPCPGAELDYNPPGTHSLVTLVYLWRCR